MAKTVRVNKISVVTNYNFHILFIVFFLTLEISSINAKHYNDYLFQTTFGLDSTTQNSCYSLQYVYSSVSRYGVIASPNYPSNYPNNCNNTWIFQDYSYNFDLEVTFESFEVENGCYDYVTFSTYECSQSHWYKPCQWKTEYKKCSNDNLHSPRIFKLPLRVNFHSDVSNSNSGFRFSYVFITKQEQDSSTDDKMETTPFPKSTSLTPGSCYSYQNVYWNAGGHITSPNYPYSYPNNCNNTWIFMNSYQSYDLEVTFDFVSLEACYDNVTFSVNDCNEYDFLYNTWRCPWQTKYTQCGGTQSTLSGRRFKLPLRINFHSDSSTSKTGFRLHYTFVSKEESSTNEFQSITTQTPSVTTTNTQGSCYSYQNVYSNAGGHITSPNYPSSYPNNCNNTWIFMNNQYESYDLEVAFDFVSLEACFDAVTFSVNDCNEYDFFHYSWRCPWRTEHTQCGGTQSTLSGRRFKLPLRINFHSDSSTSKTGFRLHYTFVSKEEKRFNWMQVATFSAVVILAVVVLVFLAVVIYLSRRKVKERAINVDSMPLIESPPAYCINAGFQSH